MLGKQSGQMGFGDLEATGRGAGRPLFEEDRRPD
jgi:hypothetical protein